MGTESVFKRYKNQIYLACCIVISLLFVSCQSLVQLHPTPTSIHLTQKKNLTTIRGFVLEKDFKSAEKENQRIREYYQRLPNVNDMALSNNIQNTQLISDLLTRIIGNEKETQALYGKIRMDEKQIKILNLTNKSLQQQVDTLKKNTADMDNLQKRITSLASEKKSLQEQIERLKEIDLNPDKVTGDQNPDEKKVPAEKMAPLIDDSL